MAPLFSLSNGRYEARAVLGGGAFGQVFLGHDVHQDVACAIKVFHPGVLIDDVLREARLQSRLSEHDHVVTVLNISITPPTPFVVMEYLPDGSAGARLASGDATVLDAVRWVRDALRGLAHAHRMNVLHRDIKPDNLLLRDDRAALSDFGIAEETVHAAAGTLPIYQAHAAPEMLAGAPSSPRTDVWAMGCTFVRLLTGEYPFATVGDVQAGNFQRPHRMNPQLPIAVSRVVERALAIDPATRYEDADEMLDAVAALRVRAAWVRVADPSTVETWQSQTVDAAYELQWVERPRVGHEVIVRRDRGSGPRAVRSARFERTSDAQRQRRHWLVEVVENARL